MNPRERVLAVLNRQKPDRTPVDIWLVPELVQKFKLELEVDHELDIYRKLEVDKIVWLGVPYKGVLLVNPNEHQEINHWGVKFEKIEASSKAEYGEVCYHPLLGMEDIAELETYPWPHPNDFDYQAAAIKAKTLAKDFVTLGPWISIFEVYCSMRSLEEALMDLIAEPEFLHAALDKIAWSQGEMLRRFLIEAEGAVDMVFLSDDLGSQSSQLMSMEAFNEFLYPRLKAWCDIAHTYGAKVFFHTDGACEPFISRLIEMGVDVLNPIQHICKGMDCKTLKEKYGKDLIFHGGVENQNVLPFGTVEEVVKETLACLNDLGPGYIPCSCHFAQADTPVENIMALINTAKTYNAGVEGS